METITVRIQGESDWIQSVFKVQDLNELKDPALFLPAISAKIGRLLDIGTETLSVESRKKIETLLSQYVANLNIYQQMLSNELHSLFITSFRAKGPLHGYMTRSAGAAPDHIGNSLVLILDNPSMPLPDPGYFLLLKMISQNEFYKKDKYHSKSTFHIIHEQAFRISKNIEIRERQDVQNN